MARKKVDEASISRMMAAGLGVGHHSGYTPWLRVKRGDFSSSGVSAIVPDPEISGRAHHTLSRGELALCLELLFSKPFDLREQFPLLRFPGKHPLLDCGRRLTDAAALMLPLNPGTVAIAADCGIRSPRYAGSSTQFVMTTDFLVTRLDDRGRPALSAYSFKPTRRLEYGDRVIELLELERCYWKALGVEWRLRTEQDLHPAILANLGWCWRYAATVEPWAKHPERLRAPFIDAIVAADWRQPLRNVLAWIARRLRWDYGLAVAMFRHCVWRRDIAIDLRTRINLPHPVGDTPVVMVPPAVPVAQRRRG